MKMRGKVLREPNAGPGLLMVQGQQYKFSLEGLWTSEVPPKPGLDVDVDLDQNLQILAITAIPPSQIAREQAEEAAAKIKEKGGKLFGEIVAKCGAPSLVAAGLLVLGWFFLTAVSIQIPLLGKLDLTVWPVLQFVNANDPAEALDRSTRGSAGIYGLLAIVALAGPFIHHFWKDKRAVLGGLAPLLFMLIIGIMARSSLLNAFGGKLSGDFGEMARQAQSEAMREVSLGLGAYLSGLASLYFAAVGLKQFLPSRRLTKDTPAKSTQAAA